MRKILGILKKKRYLFIILSLMFIALNHVVFAGDKKPTAADILRVDVDVLWTLVAAFLVFFMQAGFAMVEAGFTRAKNAANIIMKNLMDFAAGSLAFWLIGASLMFGENPTGFIGTPDFALTGWLGIEHDATKFSNLIFQTVFAATAATIVSGAMAERTKFASYLVYSVVVTALIYPIFGSWAWNSLWSAGIEGWGETKGWLEKLGFIDFAGSTVVHSVGGWLGLAGAVVLGARRGRYVNGSVKPIPGHSLTMAGLGVFILWFGWFGFNAGSTTSVAEIGKTNTSFATIAVMTNLSAAAGALGSLITGWFILKKPDVGITLNGALAGLVAITAGCANASPAGSAIIGFTAGIIVVFSVLLLDKLKIDDPVGAISVHGTAGAWGTLAIGLLASEKYGGTAGSWSQVGIQAIGVGAAFVFAFGAGLILFFILKKTIGLRVTEEEEAQGLDLTEHGAEAYADFRISQR